MTNAELSSSPMTVSAVMPIGAIGYEASYEITVLNAWWANLGKLAAHSGRVRKAPTMMLNHIQNLAEILVRAAEIAPHREALKCRTESITFQDLDRTANRIAHALLNAGVRPGDRVGICGLKSIAMVAALQGVLRANAAYVPMDPRSPAQRLASICANCGIKVAMID